MNERHLCVRLTINAISNAWTCVGIFLDPAISNVPIYQYVVLNLCTLRCSGHVIKIIQSNEAFSEC